MCEPRFAFAAAYWGSEAVVCRATEHRCGPVVEQQLGLFDTWNQADGFACQLSWGLGLKPHDVQENRDEFHPGEVRGFARDGNQEHLLESGTRRCGRPPNMR